jgi:membrane-associated phospholipid phosphatase
MTTGGPTSSTRGAWRVPGRAEPAAPGRRSALIAALALTGVWLTAAIFRIAHLPPGPVDRWWNALMASTASPAAHTLAVTLAVVGTGLPASALAVVVGVMVGAVRGWAWGAFVVAASIISAFDVAGMKTLAMRTRPDPAFGLLNAFPSGHTANAALLGTVVFLLLRHVVVRSLAIVWFLSMAWSRTALHAHWLTDVLAAIVAGAATAVLLLAACRGAIGRGSRLQPIADGPHERTSF